MQDLYILEMPDNMVRYFMHFFEYIHKVVFNYFSDIKQY